MSFVLQYTDNVFTFHGLWSYLYSLLMVLHVNVLTRYIFIEIKIQLEMIIYTQKVHELLKIYFSKLIS